MSGMKTEERRNVIGFISGQKWLASAYLQRSALHLNARPRVSLDSPNHCVGTAQSVRRNCFNGEQKQQLKLALWKVSTANWGWHRNTKESLTLPCSFHCPWWLWVCLRGATRLKKKKALTGCADMDFESNGGTHWLSNRLTNLHCVVTFVSFWQHFGVLVPRLEQLQLISA